VTSLASWCAEQSMGSPSHTILHIRKSMYTPRSKRLLQGIKLLDNASGYRFLYTPLQVTATTPLRTYHAHHTRPSTILADAKLSRLQSKASMVFLRCPHDLIRDRLDHHSTRHVPWSSVWQGLVVDPHSLRLYPLASCRDGYHLLQ
jgi:hypothetical protein